jgi:hypothetical protein
MKIIPLSDKLEIIWKKTTSADSMHRVNYELIYQLDAIFIV